MHCMASTKWSYDVFLSFRGKDTREGFTSHLYTALRLAGIWTFMDIRLSKGEYRPQLHRGIKQSRFLIVVFLENFASSQWCLDELVKIMACKETTKERQVIPVFYKIEPSEISYQTGKTGEHFTRFSKKFWADLVKLRTWRAAMEDAANLSGFTFKEGYV